MKLATGVRRFRPPCSTEELDACFVMRDRTGQQLAYVYFEDEPGRRSAAKLLTKDEAPADRGATLVVAALSRLFFQFRPPPNPHCLMRKVCPDQLLSWRILADHNVLSILGGRAKVIDTIQIV
jgi:hypothetical protein